MDQDQISAQWPDLIRAMITAVNNNTNAFHRIMDAAERDRNPIPQQQPTATSSRTQVPTLSPTSRPIPPGSWMTSTPQPIHIRTPVPPVPPIPRTASPAIPLPSCTTSSTRNSSTTSSTRTSIPQQTQDRHVQPTPSKRSTPSRH